MNALLTVEQLTVRFATARGPLTAVEDVSFEVQEGRTTGVLGESGSGKSVTALGLMRLLPAASISGRAVLEGRDLLTLSDAQLRAARGRRIAMIFQDPMSALNPSMRIVDQIAEPLIIHGAMSRSAARSRALELMEEVKITPSALRARAYPAELSGGLRQRAVIAMALACKPAVLIADEPTTALDVSVQAQIMELLCDLQASYRMGIVLISHDLPLLAETCDSVVVMYGGHVVERGPAHRVLRSPQHPYTAGLLASSLTIDRDVEQLNPIEGSVPELGAFPPGCRFSNRCGRAQTLCREVVPSLTRAADDSSGLRCHSPLPQATA